MKYLVVTAFAVLTYFSTISRSYAQASEPYLGEVLIFAGNFCPVGWSTMQGQLLPISEYAALFSILGTTYGGNGTTNFALPTAKPIFTANRATFTQCIALQGVFPSRN